MALFAGFLDDARVRLFGVEAAVRRRSARARVYARRTLLAARRRGQAGCEFNTPSSISLAEARSATPPYKT